MCAGNSTIPPRSDLGVGWDDFQREMTILNVGSGDRGLAYCLCRGMEENGIIAGDREIERE